MHGSSVMYCQVSNQKLGQWEGERNVQRVNGRGNIQWHHYMCSYSHGEVWEGGHANVPSSRVRSIDNNVLLNLSALSFPSG